MNSLSLSAIYMMEGKIIVIILVVAIAVVIVNAQSRNDIGKLIDLALLIIFGEVAKKPY